MGAILVVEVQLQDDRCLLTVPSTAVYCSLQQATATPPRRTQLRRTAAGLAAPRGCLDEVAEEGQAELSAVLTLIKTSVNVSTFSGLTCSMTSGSIRSNTFCPLQTSPSVEHVPVVHIDRLRLDPVDDSAAHLLWGSVVVAHASRYNARELVLRVERELHVHGDVDEAVSNRRM